MNFNKNQFYKQLGNRIKQRRLELGISQTELATLAGLDYKSPKTSIAHMEHGLEWALVPEFE